MARRKDFSDMAEGLDFSGELGEQEETRLTAVQTTALEVQQFDYTLVDSDTAEYLHTQEKRIEGIVVNAYYELGEIFSETQDRLANCNHNKGLFLKLRKILFIVRLMYIISDRVSFRKMRNDQNLKFSIHFPAHFKRIFPHHRHRKKQ